MPALTLSLRLLALAAPLLLSLPGEARPVRGAPGGPASGAGVRPGAGWGAPGLGVTRAPAAGAGYWAARPWTTGWYGAQPLAWWGTAALATAAATSAAVVTAVNTAAASQSAWIVVPQTPLQLNYPSVLAVGATGVRFTYLANGISLAAVGDCSSGLLDGAPVPANRAGLLHAACVVAYGSGA